MQLGAFILAGFAAVASCISANAVAENISQLSRISQSLVAPANNLAAADAALMPAGQGNFPPIIQGLTDIGSRTGGFRNEAERQEYREPDSNTILNAFRIFALAHTVVLNGLIRGASLFDTIPEPVREPVLAALVDSGTAIDYYLDLAFAMAVGVGSIMLDEVKILNETLSTAEESYNGSHSARRALRLL